MLDPLRLRLVLELQRHGSISRAAEACDLSQPAASTHLRKLESAVGRRLHEPADRGTRLTDAGRVLARSAAVVLSTLEGLEQELAALDSGVTGILRIAACDGFGNYVLPELLAEFAAEYPGAEIHVRVARSGDVARDVAHGDAHLGIAGELRHVPGIATKRLMRDDLVGIAPPEAEHLGDSPVDPLSLANEVLVVSSRQSSSRAITERVAKRVDWQPDRLLQVDSVEAVKRAVRAGLGVALVSRLAIADELERGDLLTFSLRGAERVQRWLETVHPEHGQPVPLEAAFERSLRRLAGARVATNGI